jgi:hypothetical protein
MFGASNTTIQGAIVEGGGNAGALTTFNNLITFSNVNLFDPLYSGQLITLTQVRQSLQYRNYPKFFTAVTIVTNLGSGYSSQSNACQGSGNIATVYLSEGGDQGLYSAFSNGKRLWSNTSLTTPFNGGNLWFKTSTGANNGDSFQVGTDGFIQQWGGSCAIISNPGVSCNTPVNYSGGQNYPSEFAINLGSSTGNVTLSITPLEVPDRFIVFWNSATVIDTGYRGSTSYDIGGIDRNDFKNSLAGKLDPLLLVTYPNFTEFPDDGYPRVNAATNFTFNKNLSSPNGALVRVYAPTLGTRWTFNLGCPG